jgi:RES domain-containing protein
MAPDPKSVGFDDVAFRYSDYDVPLWARPNSRGGRWHHAGEAATQYLSLSVDGSWAELVRREELRTPEELRLVRMPMWVLRIRESRLADYSTFEKAEAAGFAPEALVDEDYTRCQNEAARLRAESFRGVLAPSASCPGEANLTLFGPRIAVGWDTAPEKLLSSFVPTKRLAVGHPPEEVLARVRHHGAVHVGRAEYEAAR